MSEKDKEYTIDYFEHQANEINKKYIEELDRVLAIYKRALELACQFIRNKVADKDVGALSYEWVNCFINKAKKELEE